VAKAGAKAPQKGALKKKTRAATTKNKVKVTETAAVLSKGERTRRRIVGYATLIIYEKGYGKATIEDVIEAAGITKGSFYFHFASKEELGYAVIENASSHIMERIKNALERPGLSPYRRIEAMLLEIQGIVEAADCSRGCILGNLALEMSHTNTGFRDRIAQAFKGWSSLIASELEEMKRNGELPPDFDSTAYADFALSSLEGGIMMSKVALDPAPMRNSIALTLKQFDALRGSTGSSVPVSEEIK
jgi:TetR/AcrR family transcriptional regulator, transcriptional repressor for nem operon